MLQTVFPSSTADPDSTLALIRRLVLEFALGQWRRYVLAFLLMGVYAACTAIPVYLVSDMVNMANIQHSFSGVVAYGSAAALIFAVRGAAAY
jgi:ATP-binding cassette subfamily B protein